jgi:carbon storage regulator
MIYIMEARMLVLTRKVDQNIVIGEDIVITVCAIRGDRIGIGIQAPRDVPIVRKELLPVEELAEEETNR